MLKGDVKHGKWFWCATCDIHVKNRDDRDFTIGRRGDHKNDGGHKKALVNMISIADLNNREKEGDILNRKENKQLYFGKKSNTSPFTDFLSKKRKNIGSGTKTPSVTGVANGFERKKLWLLIHQPIKTFRCER